MKIKTLLLGSAAALVAVSGARAADAVVIPEPELVEYVRVCDTYGTGFFYIPGTETCMQIGGHVRYEMNFATDSNVPTLTRNEANGGLTFTFVESFDPVTGESSLQDLFDGIDDIEDDETRAVVQGALDAIFGAQFDEDDDLASATFDVLSTTTTVNVNALAAAVADGLISEGNALGLLSALSVANGVGAGNDGWNKRSEIRLTIDTRNETELGTLRSFIRLGYADDPRTGQPINVERAFIELAGFTIGKQATFWDYQVGADGDGLFSGGPGAVGMVAYTANAGGFAWTISLEDDNGDADNYVPDVVFDVAGSIGSLGIRGGVAYNESLDAVSAKITGSYDFGPATLALGYQYSDEDALGGEYMAQFEHVIGADIAADLTDKLSARAGLNYGMDWFNTSVDAFRVGAGINYKLVEGFDMDARVVHTMYSGDAGVFDDVTTARIRFTRTF